MSLRAPLVLLLATACQFPQPNDSGFSSDVVLTAASTGEVASGSSEGGSSEANGGSSTSDGSASASTGNDNAEDTQALILDVGNTADIGGGAPAGCKGKIDFLFVISRSPPSDRQTRLIDAFPDFVAELRTKFDDLDYHVMVIDGDHEWGFASCDAECADSGSCQVEDYPCDKLDLVTQCDRMIGAGNVFAAGADAANEPCNIADGKRYLSSDQADLHETFKCIARVGANGRGNLGESLATAMTTQLRGIGGCNDGFLRNDALLMVTMVGGWDDVNSPQHSKGTPDDWANAVVEAKHGEIKSVVMLDFGDTSFPWQDRLWQLTQLFEYGLVTSSEDLDFRPAFSAAASLVEDACSGFVAPS